MTESIIVAVITGAVTLIGTIVTILTANSKTLYRIEQLEKKQDKYNNLQERVYNLEGRADLGEERIKVANHRIDDLEKEASK